MLLLKSIMYVSNYVVPLKQAWEVVMGASRNENESQWISKHIICNWNFGIKSFIFVQKCLCSSFVLPYGSVVGAQPRRMEFEEFSQKSVSWTYVSQHHPARSIFKVTFQVMQLLNFWLNSSPFFGKTGGWKMKLDDFRQTLSCLWLFCLNEFNIPLLFFYTFISMILTRVF